MDFVITVIFIGLLGAGFLFLIDFACNVETE